MVEKIKKKLSSWKGKTLSFVWRVSLFKSFNNVITLLFYLFLRFLKVHATQSQKYKKTFYGDEYQNLGS